MNNYNNNNRKKIKENFLFEIYKNLIKKENLHSEISFNNNNNNNLDKEFDFSLNVSNNIINKNYIIDFFKNEEIYLLNFYHCIFSLIDFKEIARLIIGFELKEIKYFVDEIFLKLKDYIKNDYNNLINILPNENQNEIYNNYLCFTFDVNNFIKEKLNEFKKSKKLNNLNNI